MITVLMSKDIREREPKIIGPFTSRQIICLLISLCYAVPMVFLLPIEDITLRFMVAILAMAPVVACGWVKSYGMPLEKFVKKCIWPLLVQPRVRKYKTENTMAKLETVRKPVKKVKKSKDFKAFK